MMQSYLVLATPNVLPSGHLNNGRIGGARFRVRAKAVTRDGNVLADTDRIHAEIERVLRAAKPGTGTWTYSVSARGETFDFGSVNV